MSQTRSLDALKYFAKTDLLLLPAENKKWTIFDILITLTLGVNIIGCMMKLSVCDVLSTI